jgi:hypothetical protein
MGTGAMSVIGVDSFASATLRSARNSTSTTGKTYPPV